MRKAFFSFIILILLLIVFISGFFAGFQYSENTQNPLEIDTKISKGRYVPPKIEGDVVNFDEKFLKISSGKLSYELPFSKNFSIDIYNLSSQRIKKGDISNLKAGQHVIIFTDTSAIDGKTEIYNITLADN